MAYNLTFLDNSTNIVNIASGTNDMISGLFVVGFLLSLWVILFFAFKNFDTSVAMIGNSFITTIIAIFFYAIGWMAIEYLMFPIILLIGSLLFKIFAD